MTAALFKPNEGDVSTMETVSNWPYRSSIAQVPGRLS